MFKYLKLLKQYGNIWNYFYIFIGLVALLIFVLPFILNESFEEQYIFLPIAIYFIGITFYRLNQKSLNLPLDYQEKIEEENKKGFFFWFPIILFVINIPLIVIGLGLSNTEGEFIRIFHGFVMFFSLFAIIMTIAKPNRVQYILWGLIKVKNKVLATYFVGCLLIFPTIFQIVILLQLLN